MHTNALDVRFWERRTQKDDDAATFFSAFSVWCAFVLLFYIIHIHFATTKNWPRRNHAVWQWWRQRQRKFCHRRVWGSSAAVMSGEMEKFFIIVISFSISSQSRIHSHLIWISLHSNGGAYTRSTFSDKQQQLTSDIIMKSQKSSMATREKSLQHIVWQWICEWMEMIQPPRGVCCADFFALYRATAAVESSQCCCWFVTVEPSTECAVWSFSVGKFSPEN